VDIENLSFLTELTDEDASKVNGGAIQDISGGLFSPFPGAPDLITFDPLYPYPPIDWGYSVPLEPFKVLPDIYYS